MGDPAIQIAHMLSAALDSNPDVRRKGEAHVKAMSQHPGYAHGLVQAAMRQVIICIVSSQSG